MLIATKACPRPDISDPLARRRTKSRREPGARRHSPISAADVDAQSTPPADCTNHPSRVSGERLRLESVPNALGQGKAAALAIVGAPVPYDEVPWFWSDQYDLKLQMAGISKPGDQVVIRGVVDARKFSACYLRDGVFVACQAVNMAKDFLQSKKLISHRVRPDPSLLADANTPLQAFLPDAAGG